MNITLSLCRSIIHQDLLPVQQQKLKKDVRVPEGVTAIGLNNGIKQLHGIAYDSGSIPPSLILYLVRE